MLDPIADAPERASVSVQVDRHLVSSEALLKACYWYTRDFHYAVEEAGGVTRVLLTSKGETLASPEQIQAAFTQSMFDFELRERVIRQTSEVRDLLLAKAFSESGVLEDAPQGVFGDVLEEVKPNGMFRILSNP